MDVLGSDNATTLLDEAWPTLHPGVPVAEAPASTWLARYAHLEAYQALDAPVGPLLAALLGRPISLPTSPATLLTRLGVPA